MKSNVMPSIVQIEANELKNLLSEVKETIATTAVEVKRTKSNTQSFGIVDLWNIRRGIRTATQPRRWTI
ncbi:MAG: hypothetical protein RLZZ28_858 [Bacteroidota bacterium]